MENICDIQKEESFDSKVEYFTIYIDIYRPVELKRRVGGYTASILPTFRLLYIGRHIMTYFFFKHMNTYIHTHIYTFVMLMGIITLNA